MTKLAWLWNTTQWDSFDDLADEAHKGDFDGLVVKVLDGPRWQGMFGQGGVGDIPLLNSERTASSWRESLSKRNLEFHGTAVVWGDDETWVHEAEKITQVAQHTDSFTLDVEPSSFGNPTDGGGRYFSEDWANFEPLITHIKERSNVPLIMSVPPQKHAVGSFLGDRTQVPVSLYARFFDALAPQVYWDDTHLDMHPFSAMAQVYGVSQGGMLEDFSQFNLPIHPYVPMNASSKDIKAFEGWVSGYDVQDFTVFRLGHGPSSVWANFNNSLYQSNPFELDISKEFEGLHAYLDHMEARFRKRNVY